MRRGMQLQMPDAQGEIARPKCQPIERDQILPRIAADRVEADAVHRREIDEFGLNREFMQARRYALRGEGRGKNGEGTGNNKKTSHEPLG